MTTFLLIMYIVCFGVSVMIYALADAKRSIANQGNPFVHIMKSAIWPVFLFIAVAQFAAGE